MLFNLTNIKMKETCKGVSMSATFVINNIEVCDYTDKGDGSEPLFDIYMTSEAMQLFTAWEYGLTTLPTQHCEGIGEIGIDKDMFICFLHSALMKKTEFKLLAA